MAETPTAAQPPHPQLAAACARRIDGVVIGVLLGFGEDGSPLVAFPGNPEERALPARSTARLQDSDAGREVALLFEGGDPRLPMVIGLLQQQRAPASSLVAEVDKDRITLRADKQIVLKCGKASITLTSDGKVIIRGSYLLSRSSGPNRIKGGSVQLN
jgi:hypothetical protein